MTYAVKEIFYTLQGEGKHAGRPAVFCRFAGCNLWSGREEDRATAACTFCDTDFVGTNGIGGGKFPTPDSLADAVQATWRGVGGERYVVCTGGEPTLQLDEPLVEALHQRGFTVAIETNGTRPVASGVDWICVSPKGTNPLIQTSGNELKLVFPQPAAMPDRFENLSFDHLLLQPMDGDQLEENTAAAVAWCLKHPRWHLSLQTHKILRIA